jgi:hypothetical protein
MALVCARSLNDSLTSRDECMGEAKLVSQLVKPRDGAGGGWVREQRRDALDLSEQVRRCRKELRIGLCGLLRRRSGTGGCAHGPGDG